MLVGDGGAQQRYGRRARIDPHIIIATGLTLSDDARSARAPPVAWALLPRLTTLAISGNAIRSIPTSTQHQGTAAVLALLKKRLPQ